MNDVIVNLDKDNLNIVKLAEQNTHIQVKDITQIDVDYLLSLIDALNSNCEYYEERIRNLENKLYSPDDCDDDCEYPFDL